MDWRVALFAAGCAALFVARGRPGARAHRLGHGSGKRDRVARSPGRGTGSDGDRRCSSHRPRCPWRCWCREACCSAPTFARRAGRRLRRVVGPDRPTATAAIALCQRSRTGRGDGTHLHPHRLNSRSDPLGCDDEPLLSGFAYITLVDIENQPTRDGSGHTVQFRRVSADYSRPCGFACDEAGCSNGLIRCRAPGGGGQPVVCRPVLAGYRSDRRRVKRGNGHDGRGHRRRCERCRSAAAGAADALCRVDATANVAFPMGLVLRTAESRRRSRRRCAQRSAAWIRCSRWTASSRSKRSLPRRWRRKRSAPR